MELSFLLGLMIELVNSGTPRLESVCRL